MYHVHVQIVPGGSGVTAVCRRHILMYECVSCHVQLFLCDARGGADSDTRVGCLLVSIVGQPLLRCVHEGKREHDTRHAAAGNVMIALCVTF